MKNHKLPPSLLALDIATHCGWASYQKGKVLFGTEDFTNKQHEGAGMRYLRLHQWLVNNHTDKTIIVYEAVYGHIASAVYSQHIYGGYLSVIQAFCEEYKIPYIGYGVTEVKKNWTGKGKASKKQMIETAYKLKYNVSDDNQADALAVLFTAKKQFSDLFKK